MTKDESIALAVKLQKDFKEIEKIQDKISENEKTAANLYYLQPKHYSAANYFKPYFAASFIFVFISLLPAYGIITVSVFLDKSNHNNDNAYVPYAVAAGIAFIFALIHLIGGFVARHKSRYMNNLEIQRVLGDKRKIERLSRETDELENSLIEIKTRLGENNNLIPSELRNSKSMMDVKKLLLAGKAESFNDAIEYLNLTKLYDSHESL